jgi:acyl-CoA synthetase (AMP-forming)/AMP-acid ligase II
LRQPCFVALNLTRPLPAKYALPLRLHVVDALPRNPAGKAPKFEFGQELQKTE